MNQLTKSDWPRTTPQLTMQHIITNSTSTTKRDTNIEQRHRHAGTKWVWSVYLENQWLLYAMQMPELLRSCTQGNYMYMHVYMSILDTPPGNKKTGYLLTATLPASCLGHPKSHIQLISGITYMETVVLSITSEGQVPIYSWPCCGWDGWDLKGSYHDKTWKISLA